MNGFTYNFPQMRGRFTDRQVADVLREKVCEYAYDVSNRDYEHALVSLVEVLQACEVGLRQYAMPQVWDTACAVERKHRKRGHYAESLCFGRCEDGCPWWNAEHSKCDRFSEEG